MEWHLHKNRIQIGATLIQVFKLDYNYSLYHESLYRLDFFCLLSKRFKSILTGLDFSVPDLTNLTRGAT